MSLALLALAPLAAAPQTSYEWTQIDGPVRFGRQASWDAARGRLVVLGAEGETWELDGTTWLQRASLGGATPSPRRGGGVMASDPRRGITLLFGGNPTGSAFAPQLGDTWSWDGRRWSAWSGTPSPPARVSATMTFDPAHDCFVLYGGQGDSGLLYDTWEHDAGGWRQVATANAPAEPRGEMVYDSARGVIVLVADPAVLRQPVPVYEYDGVDWTPRPIAGDWPLTRGGMSLAYDESREVTVLIGGKYDAEEIWEWDGGSWERVHVLAEPWRFEPTTWYDASRERVVSFGGLEIYPGSTSIDRTDLHTWDGTTLAELSPDQRPYRRFGEVLFADPERRTITLSAGWWSWIGNDTWEWDGNSWRELEPAQQVPDRRETSFTFDSQRGLGLMFGGFKNPNYFDDLWAWDGQEWSLVDTTPRPYPRGSAAMAFDTARGVAVLFGGGDGPLSLCCTDRDDTWEWNGSSWTQLFPTQRPSPRRGAGMAYDEGRGVMVLFGGRDRSGLQYQLTDTWEWDGDTWQEVFPSTTPPRMLDPKLAYDRVRGRIVLVGATATGILPPMEMWDYDGSTWTLRHTEGRSIGGGTNLLWDDARQRLTLYDGEVLRTWTATPAAATSYGTGCGSAPPLTVRTRPRLGEEEFGFEARVAAGQPTLFAIGLNAASTPVVGGCTLLVKPLRWILATADGHGNASAVIGLKDDIAYRGLSIRAQAGVVDDEPAGLWGLSAGVEAVLGD